MSATLFEVDDTGVAWLTLNRPDAANARNQQMRFELLDAYDRAAADDDVRVLVLTGAGDRFFCAGMDLKEAGGDETQAEKRDRLRAARDIEVLAAFPKPTIAAVNGYALGGGLEMAMACDLRIAAVEAVVGLTEVDHGLVPGGGGTQRLPRLVGLPVAFDLIYRARKIDAVEAARSGLVHQAVPRADLRQTVAAVAAEIAAKPARALRAAKELLRKSLEMPLAAGVDAELDALLFLMQANTDASGPPIARYSARSGDQNGGGGGGAG